MSLSGHKDLPTLTHRTKEGRSLKIGGGSVGIREIEAGRRVTGQQVEVFLETGEPEVDLFGVPTPKRSVRPVYWLSGGRSAGSIANSTRKPLWGCCRSGRTRCSSAELCTSPKGNYSGGYCFLTCCHHFRALSTGVCGSNSPLSLGRPKSSPVTVARAREAQSGTGSTAVSELYKYLAMNGTSFFEPSSAIASKSQQRVCAELKDILDFIVGMASCALIMRKARDVCSMTPASCSVASRRTNVGLADEYRSWPSARAAFALT